MNPTASPRHPWKALAVVLAMFAAVHGARAHVDGHPHGFSHLVIADGGTADRDCPDADVDGDAEDGQVIDVFDAIDSDDPD
jgi:hypothetical protein